MHRKTGGAGLAGGDGRISRSRQAVPEDPDRSGFAVAPRAAVKPLDGLPWRAWRNWQTRQV